VPDLLVPRSIAAEEQAAQINAEIDAQVTEARTLSDDLKRIDPTLSVIWVGENADDPEVVPARWHIRKRIAGSIDAYIPLVGPGGEYREPGPWVLGWLQEADLWNPQVHRSRQEAKERHREAKIRAEKRADEQRRDEMLVAVRAAKRIRGDSGMTTRTDLKRRGDGIKKPETGLILP
jgi:hypothetical protein